MSDRERDVLDFLLRAESPASRRFEHKRSSLEPRASSTADVLHSASPLTRPLPLVPDVNPKTPIDAEAASVGHDPAYELLVFTKDGWLDYVEPVTYGGPVSSTFPPVSEFHPARQPC
jgi:hypothetical protein